jgi:hypothetical protein
MDRRALFLGALTAVSGAILVVACGGDDQSPNEVAPDGSTTSDATTEAETPAEAGTTPDSSAPDGGPASDAGEGGACVAFDASGLDEASVAAGMAQVLQVYHCTSCHQRASQVIDDAGHGVTLSGNNDGLGDSGTIFPPNLTNDPSTGLGCWTDPQVVNAILTGIDNEGMALCPPMPKFGNPATTADGGLRPGFPMDAGTAREIVDYLRSLPAVVNQVPDTTCPAAGGGDGGADGASDAASE